MELWPPPCTWQLALAPPRFAEASLQAGQGKILMKVGNTLLIIQGVPEKVKCSAVKINRSSGWKKHITLRPQESGLKGGSCKVS